MLVGALVLAALGVGAIGTHEGQWALAAAGCLPAILVCAIPPIERACRLTREGANRTLNTPHGTLTSWRAIKDWP